MRKLSRYVLVLFALLSLVLVLPKAGAQSDEPPPGTFGNPLNTNGGADPWLTYYEGNYYLATTTWSSTLVMRRSPTLAGLKTAEPVEIYHQSDPSRCCNMWAPEFHLLTAPDGTQHWYFHYSAGLFPAPHSLPDQHRCPTAPHRRFDVRPGPQSGRPDRGLH